MMDDTIHFVGFFFLLTKEKRANNSRFYTKYLTIFCICNTFLLLFSTLSCCCRHLVRTMKFEGYSGTSHLYSEKKMVTCDVSFGEYTKVSFGTGYLNLDILQCTYVHTYSMGFSLQVYRY